MWHFLFTHISDPNAACSVDGGSLPPVIFAVSNTTIGPLVVHRIGSRGRLTCRQGYRLAGERVGKQ